MPFFDHKIIAETERNSPNFLFEQDFFVLYPYFLWVIAWLSIENTDTTYWGHNCTIGTSDAHREAIYEQGYRAIHIPVIQANNKLVITQEVSTSFNFINVNVAMKKTLHEFYYFIENIETMG